MLYTYHVHSTYSDGTTSILEMVQAAVNLGIDELGLSDHLAIPTRDPIPWSMLVSDLPAYFNEVQSAACAVEGKLTIRFGVEADFDPRTAEDLADVLHAYPFDYVIGSVHFVDGFPVDKCEEKWRALTELERNDLMRAYWNRITQMAQSGLSDFVGHIDLYKKFGYRPTIDLSREVETALDAIARAGLAIEVNTAGWFFPSAEAYPSESILRQCVERKIPLLVDSDAHVPENLTRGFRDGDELITKVGCAQTAVFAGRQMSLIPARSKP